MARFQNSNANLKIVEKGCVFVLGNCAKTYIIFFYIIFFNLYNTNFCIQYFPHGLQFCCSDIMKFINIINCFCSKPVTDLPWSAIKNCCHIRFVVIAAYGGTLWVDEKTCGFIPRICTKNNSEYGFTFQIETLRSVGLFGWLFRIFLS